MSTNLSLLQVSQKAVSQAQMINTLWSGSVGGDLAVEGGFWLVLSG